MKKLNMQKLKITFNAPVTLVFSLICLISLLIGALTGGAATQLLFSTYRYSLASPLTYLRFFTHIFGHSGWEHFFGNITYILLLGPMLEEKYGSKMLIQVMVITAFATGLVNFILFPKVMLCGASCVVFAFILMTSFTEFKAGQIPVTFILIALIFIGGQIIQAIFVRDDIANLSHIIGGIIGAVIGYLANRKSL